MSGVALTISTLVLQASYASATVVLSASTLTEIQASACLLALGNSLPTPQLTYAWVYVLLGILGRIMSVCLTALLVLLIP